MGLASLGFANGPALNFRIDPDSIEYNIKVHTSVTNTVGGRVIQVLGSSVSDVVVQGSIGEAHNLGQGSNGEHAGVSWKLAVDFFQYVQGMQMLQSAGANAPGSSSGSANNGFFLKPATFVYSPKGLRFQCYIKSISDPAGDGSTGVVHKVGRSNYQYVLTLFPVQDSGDLVKAGMSNGALDQARAKAVDSYIQRISQGIGWKFTAYNGGSTPSAPWEKDFQKSHEDATPDSTLDREE